MKAIDIIKELQFGANVGKNTCDTVKSGDTEKEVKKLAVTMIGTVDVLREVIAWGADMLIVHEPLYYSHMDDKISTSVALAKQEMIEKSGLVIFRDHDNMHSTDPDGIFEGEMEYLGLSGTMEKCEHRRPRIFTLDTPQSAIELAALMEDKLNVEHIRIAGERNKKSSRLICHFGAGSVSEAFELLASDEADILLCGETCEWMICEYARDAAALGLNKSVIVMGHVGSERDGMRLLERKLKNNHTELETRYFECGEVYSYR